MDVIYSLIPGMMFFGLIFLAVLIWAVKKGQYEDMEGNASRILLDDDEEMMDYPDETTDRTTSHLTNPAKDAGQVIGYSHSTDETTSHSTRLSKNDNQVAGYRLSKDDSQVAGYDDSKGGEAGKGNSELK